MAEKANHPPTILWSIVIVDALLNDDSRPQRKHFASAELAYFAFQSDCKYFYPFMISWLSYSKQQQQHHHQPTPAVVVGIGGGGPVNRPGVGSVDSEWRTRAFSRVVVKVTMWYRRSAILLWDSLTLVCVGLWIEWQPRECTKGTLNTGRHLSIGMKSIP